MKTKLFMLFLALIASVGTLFASNTEVNGIWYNFNKSTNTAEVTYRGDMSFSYSNEYTGSVTIPSSVKYNNITYNVTSIGEYAFCDCTGLTSVTIPNSVTSIGSGAFSGCSGLTRVVVKNGNTVYDSRNNCNAIIETSTNTLIAGCKNTIIPNSVTRIGNYAFSGCTGLTSVTIPNSVTSIGDKAFYGCTGLTSVTIPNSVISIGGQAFAYCSGLTSVTIPNSVTSIRWQAFQGCSALTNVIIGNSVTDIRYESFSHCSGLTSITIPNSVTSIGESAFQGCSALTSVIIGNSVTSIGWFAFYGCSSLTSITIPNSVISIGGQAFQGCSALTSVIIGNSVTSIREFAFYGCTGLTSVVVENGNTVYDSRDNCNAIIRYSTLIFGCKNTIIPNSVTSIGEYAFYDCTGLTSVTIPNSVTSIGELAFNGCTGLTSITCNANVPPTCGRETFQYVDQSIPVYVPGNRVEAYKAADVWKEFTNIQPIQAEEAEVIEIVAKPTDNSVVVQWPAVSGAATYELVIKDKDGNIICTLVFNANGQLTQIAFNAPARNNAPQQTQATGFSFTVTGLEEGTSYDLTMTAKDSSGTTLDSNTIAFTTTGGEQGLDQISNDQLPTTNKVIVNGQILILRGDHTYTLTGQEVE